MTKLGDFATAPRYNIKAVVQATNISPSTLRAWERRYEFCTPHRSDSGYRLYSDQDIAVIRWLKIQVDSGMAISQAVTWYQSLLKDGKTLDQTVLPTPNNEQIAPPSTFLSQSPKEKAPSFENLQKSLLDALSAYQEAEATQVMTEAYSHYSVEKIGEELITPVLIEIGTLWHEGKLSIAREHYATNYIKQHLFSILHATRHNPKGLAIWVGCAPKERHEIGTILLSIYLKRAGFQVKYLGQNLPVDEFSSDIEREKPAMVMFSASSIESAQQLEQLAKKITALDMPRLVIGYGGRIFNEQPELREQITGVYLGESSLQAVEIVGDLLVNGTASS